jgi:predicted dehydrogenase
MPNVTRRQFLEDSLLAAATAATFSLPRPASAAETGPSSKDKLAVAIIGCGIRGQQHAGELARLSDCDVTWVCDPDKDRADEVAAALAAKGRARPKTAQDLRRILDDQSVAAVFIATPNHWHALAAIWAMQAGKDVYLEKPISHNVSEGRRIVQTARKLNRICQGGTQNRSNGALAEAIRHIHDGKLGEVKLARSIVYGRRESIGGPLAGTIPANVDYNLWAGPAPLEPLTRPKFHYDWHWFWNTGNGELGNNNIHSVDVCRWGLRVSGLGRSVVSYGGRLGYQDAAQTPNTQVVVFDFGDKTLVAETRGLKTAPFHPNFKSGWVFVGSEGIIADTSLFDPAGKLVRTFTGKIESHFANFLNAVRSRNRSELNAEILEGHQSTALCHLGNISWRLGQAASPDEIRRQLAGLKGPEDVAGTFERTCRHLAENDVDLRKTPLTLGVSLRLEPEQETFLGAPAANAMLTREYRKPFTVPAEREI